MVSVGLMSFAHMHAYSYAQCLKALEREGRANLAAIWDDDPARGRDAQKTFETPFVEDCGLFLEGELAGVIVCSENIKHTSMVEAAARAGKWVLCEKPLATTAADAEAMITCCHASGVGLATAFPCRFADNLREVRKRVRGGEIGRLRAVACTNNGSYPGGWFADETLSGGGAVTDHTVHVADALRWITGKEVTGVFCAMGNVVRPGIGTDDVGSLHFEMEGGIIVSHVASWNRAETFPTWGDVTMEFVGDEGVLFVDAFSEKIDVYDDRERKVEWAYWGGNADLALVSDFVDAIREDRPPGATGLDGLRAVEITEAAYRSARTGKMVRV